MNEPWDIKPSDSRTPDSLPTFIIFCEDKVSEPEYLKFFETEKIKINLVKEQKSMMTHVLKAVHHCKENGLTDSINGVLMVSGNETQVWCVFDRDKGKDAPLIDKENIDFDESISLAESKGIRVAWSNDSFELWVLLHFDDVDDNDSDGCFRETYYDKLTEVFRNIPSPNEDLKKVLAHASYNYKKDFKSINNFRNIVRPELIPRTKEAIRRAKILENKFRIDRLHNHQKCPCTMMHYLIEELIKLGGKKI
ncbi:MAG: RloB family protein [Imperialibacter sp.]|uniref:RloB family protein n=1 Tax=Imperialibacter sp. TaxID=2038411 RepID=UPI0032EB788D